MTAEPARRSLAFARDAMKGRVLSSPTPVEGSSFVGAAADSRLVTPGRLFFALEGARVDGFDYCATAVRAGAAAVVVSAGRGQPAGCDTVPVIAVQDPRQALADLATAVRGRFAGKVVGVTGSNGKTTTKELIAAALGSAGAVLRTGGNLNTEIGLPLTVLESTEQESFWVLEMAMRARGEIAFLAQIALPHVGVVTNVAAAHLGPLGSLDEVAKAKGEIFHGLGPDGFAILPVDDARLEAEAATIPEARKCRFGAGGAKPTGPVGDPGRVRILDFIGQGVAGSVVRYAVDAVPLVVRLPLAGEHNARNGAAALAVTRVLGVPLGPAAAALATATLPPHRSKVLPSAGRTVLDDCYNANPSSMLAALATLTGGAGSSGRSFAILGDMLELGADADSLHVALGQEVADRKLAGLAVVGPLGARIADGARKGGLPADRIFATDDAELAARQVMSWSRAGDWVLVKASRGMCLERAVQVLERWPESEKAG